MSSVGAKKPGPKDGAVPGRPTAWTPEEDDALRQLVDKFGCKKWALIASKMQQKGSKQCRRRWQNYLNAEVKQGGWSAEEDDLLLEGHRKFGNRWTEIAKLVQGRTDNAVKNRFAVLVKKQAKPEKNRAKKRTKLDRDGDSIQTPPQQGSEKVAPGVNKVAREEKRPKLSVRVPKKDDSAAQVAPGTQPPPPIRLVDRGDEFNPLAEMSSLLTPSDALVLESLGDLLLNRNQMGSAGSNAAPGTPLDTPVADMASVFSFFHSLGGSPRSQGNTPNTAHAAAAAAAILRDTGVGLGGTPRTTRSQAARLSEGGQGLTADQGRQLLLKRLLGGSGAGNQPQTPTLAGLLSGNLSPLSGGNRSSPRLAPVRTGLVPPAGFSGSSHTPTDGLRSARGIAELLSSPNFTASEMQLLLATLGGENPFAMETALSEELHGLLSGAFSPVRRSPRFGGPSSRTAAML